LLEQIGLEPDRAHMFNMSSAMAGQFVSSVQEMTSKIENLGLNPLRESELQDDKASGEENSTEHQALNPELEVSK